MSNEIVEAVRERMRLADSWAKDTGYPPADYFDTMMDLRRLMAFLDARSKPPMSEEVREALAYFDGVIQGMAKPWLAAKVLAAEVRRLRGEKI